MEGRVLILETGTCQELIVDIVAVNDTVHIPVSLIHGHCMSRHF
jgi:hypothetical protein